MSLWRKVAAEAIGTFLLIYTIGASEGEPFAVGCLIWLCMIITRFISGALFNPAVTLSIATKKFIEKTLTSQDLYAYFLYTITQFACGFAAAFLAWKFTHTTFYYDFSDSYPDYKAVACEAIYTCILCLNAHMVGKSDFGLYIEGIIIVITVVTGALSIGHLTKNCLNPVVGVCMDFICYMANGHHIKNVWLYVVSPLLGGFVAAFISYVLDLGRSKSSYRNSSLFFRSSNYELEFVK